MTRRFFSERPLGGDQALLDGPEAHHLIHVLRAKAGDAFVLFDGTGGEWQAETVQVGRREVTLRLLERVVEDREVPFGLELAVALPRGDRQELLVQKAVEVGATRLIPWQCERSVAKPTDKSLERLRRTVVEACKQCGRNRLMEIAEPQEFTQVLAAEPARLSLLAHPIPTAPSVAQLLLDRCPFPAGVRFGVGPEGGFSDTELQQAQQQGWHPVRLGPRILRTETATTVLAALAMLLADAHPFGNA